MTSGPRISPVARVVALGLALLGVAGVALAAAPDLGALRAGHWWIAVAVMLGFGIAERAVFHIEHRREAITVSLSEVPTLFALVFVDLRVAVAARVIGGLASVWVERRPPLYKMVFNAGLFAFEVAVSGLVFRAVLQTTGASVTWLLAIGVVVVCVATVAGSVVVSAAIAQFEGGFIAKVAGELTRTWWVFVLNASIAGLVAAPAIEAPWLAPFAFIPLVVFWLYLRRQAAIGLELRDTQALQGFSGHIAAFADLSDIGQAAVTATADLLRASRCALYVKDQAACSLIAAVGDPIELPEEAHSDPTTSIRQRALLGAPLSSDEGVIGMLVVEHREGAETEFTDTDVDRLTALAGQLAAPVARGILHRHLEHDARHDQLTGLANRASFERSLARLLDPTEESADEPTPFTFVAVLDLDRFKEVNDTLGHHAGDELLIEVATRLSAAVDPHDHVARFAGDEFGITGRRHHLDAVDDTVRSCLQAIGRPFHVGGLEIVVNASIGISSTSRPKTATPSSLVREADIAMYHAKQHQLGHDHYRPEIDRRTPARLSLLADLRSAIADGDIELHFQPKLDLVTGVVCGAEVLARWHHPTRGNVPPGDFIAVAEQSGLIRPLTDHILLGTIRAIATLDQLGHHLNLAMNLSTHDLIDELLADRITHYLGVHGVTADRLVLEITESNLLYDSSRSRANIERLRDLGIKLSIDDFGTGYSSLAYLRRLPVSELKIDRSFVTNLVIDAQDETIVRSTIDLGHNLGLQVVAEGVETPDVIDRLRTLGCDIAQGYGICRPVPLDQLTTWLSTTRYPTSQRSTDPLAW